MTTEIQNINSLISNISLEGYEKCYEKCYESNVVINDITNRRELNLLLDDMEISLEDRVLAFSRLYELFKEDMIEEINKLCGIYMYSGSRYIEEFLIEICNKVDNLPQNLKNIIAVNLCSRGETYGYECLYNLCKRMDDSISITIRLESIKTLLEHNDFVSRCIDCFKEVIKLEKLKEDFKYKTILSLEKNIIKESEYDSYEIYYINLSKNSSFAIIELMNFFFGTVSCYKYKILSGQYLLLNNYKETDKIEKDILDIAINEDIEYNTRADACDMILRLSKNTENKQIAKDIILVLGNTREDGKVIKAKTVFENAQNVHYNEFENSILEALEFLNNIDTLRIKDYGILDFGYVKKQINLILYEEHNKYSNEDIERIKVSLNRIELDRILYSKYNFTLNTVLLKVWTYIENSEFQAEMKNRLLEELIDMCGICSTGFVSRIINTISGFGDFNYKISWRDQIISNFVGRLNYRAKNIIEIWNNEEKINIVLDTMMLKDNDSITLLKMHVKNKKLDYDFRVKDNYGNVIKSSDKKKEDKIIKDIETIMYSRKEYPTEKEMKSYFIEKVKEKNMLDDDMINEFLLEEFQSGLLSEIAEDNSLTTSIKLFFSSFLREEVISIREEMYKEFKEYLEDSEFDIYFRDAISLYESA